ncbi:hypothetical protein PBRA_000038 [Plasmodiophora brassicae]|uniref:Cation-transporting P-type ATPase N-terminal domain-containing protein n=1 Tax=Plasmodiophora brassicae TaxID=37360 RepID=A0A0G4IGF1_PLABS|nr:hypothetical protein PBRA_000038 [Plasmodiophora brassicae]
MAKRRVASCTVATAPPYTEHLLSIAELADLHPSIDAGNVGNSPGVSTDAAQALLLQDGPNCMTPAPPVSFITRVVRALIVDRFMLMLIVAGALCLLAYAVQPMDGTHLTLSLTLLVVVVLTTAMTLFQEGKAASAMSGFESLMANTAMAIRDNGCMRQVDAADLVVGDIVQIETGDQIPADLRLLDVTALEVNNASLTGETVAVRCHASQVGHDVTDVIHAGNVVFSGTLVVGGRGLGVVIRTGDRTKIGTIAALVDSTERERTRLESDMSQFVTFIGVLAFVTAIPLFVVACVRKHPIVDAFVDTFVIIMVANVPQGLPSAVATSLTIAARRLAGVNVFVRRLSAIETLGSVTVIASDKTGTLTQNRMTTCMVLIDDQRIAVQDGMETAGAAMQDVLRVAALCNMAQRTDDGDLRGNASDVAIYEFADRFAKVGVEATRTACPTLFEVPFSSQRKWMACVVAEGPRRLLLVKGAPERVAALCTTITTGAGDRVPIESSSARSALNRSKIRCMKNARRVLALAMRELAADDSSVDYQAEFDKGALVADLTMVGCIALEDPPKPSVPGAIARCRQAGIKVMMITGDHPETGQAIAKQCNIFHDERRVSITIADANAPPVPKIANGERVVVVGAELGAFNDDDWDRVLSAEEIVFTRTSPHDKREIVRRLQERGEVVAVTGDGVNDSPALKLADVGVSMGVGGSAVAKDAADIILLDDEFETLVNGIEQGRIIFDNLVKTIAYTLSSMVPQLTSILLGVGLGAPMGMSPLLLLILDLVTEAPSALSLAFEPAEPDIMTRPPRPAGGRLVSWALLAYSYLQAGLVHAAAAVLAYLFVFVQAGVAVPDVFRQQWFQPNAAPYAAADGRILDGARQMEVVGHAQIAFFATIVVGQFLHLWMCRTRRASVVASPRSYLSNRVLAAGGVLAMSIMAAIVYVDGIRDAVLGMRVPAPDPIAVFVPGVVAGLTLWVWSETRKAIIRRCPDTCLTACLQW